MVCLARWHAQCVLRWIIHFSKEVLEQLLHGIAIVHELTLNNLFEQFLREVVHVNCAMQNVFFAINKMPDVSRSKRWTSSKKRASGRNARKASITPKFKPLPPCTAIPEGLFKTIKQSSSNKIWFSSAATLLRFLKSTHRFFQSHAQAEHERYHLFAIYTLA